MFPLSQIESADLCARCGRAKHPGPAGPQCLRCLIELGAAEDGVEELADLFPELNIGVGIGFARGGFGTVYKAVHRHLRRPVALKILTGPPAHAREALALFQREMAAVGGLDHPGIVRAHDAGEREGRWYLLMEWIAGEDCASLARRHGRLPVAESCEIARQAALALHHAHRRGLVHRDVKPGNLMVTHGGPADGGRPCGVKVLDFGLAGLAAADAARPPGEDPAAAEFFLGTPGYAAPEQIAAPETADARADIYALGATLRRLLTGTAARPEPAAPMARLRPDLPPGLAALCDRLVGTDPDSRPDTAAATAAALAPWCAGADLARLFP